MLVETGGSWFNGLKLRLPRGCRLEVQFQAGSIGWCTPAALATSWAARADPRRRDDRGRLVPAHRAGGLDDSALRGPGRSSCSFNNRGYTIEAEIHDGPYNGIKNWDYAGLLEVFNVGEGKGLGIHVATLGELDSAIGRALAHDGPCLIGPPSTRTSPARSSGSRAVASPSPTAGRGPRTGGPSQEV